MMLEQCLRTSHSEVRRLGMPVCQWKSAGWLIPLGGYFLQNVEPTNWADKIINIDDWTQIPRDHRDVILHKSLI